MTHGNDSHALAMLMPVYKYSTPLAALVVVSGALLAPLSPTLRYWCLGLLAFGLGFNSLMVALAARARQVSPWLVQARMAANFCVNCVLVFVLGWYWEPIWLLLLLTPLATAIYYGRRETVFAACGTAIELLAINGVRYVLDPDVVWANQVVYAVAIVLLSLIVHEASHVAKR